MKIKVKLDSHSEIGSFRTFSTLLPFISTLALTHTTSVQADWAEQLRQRLPFRCCFPSLNSHNIYAEFMTCFNGKGHNCSYF